jgi:hypothetical protein
MKITIRLAIGIVAASFLIGSAFANYLIKDGGGVVQTVFSFVCQTTVICPGHVIIDSSGNEKATPSNPLSVTGPYTLGPQLAANAVPVAQSGYTYKNITTDATTVVKSAMGVLHTITINTPVSTGTVTIYDNTAASGTKIGTFTVPNAATPITLTYDVAFLTGLTIVSAVEIMDITVSYQ